MSEEKKIQIAFFSLLVIATVIIWIITALTWTSFRKLSGEAMSTAWLRIAASLASLAYTILVITYAIFYSFVWTDDYFGDLEARYNAMQQLTIFGNLFWYIAAAAILSVHVKIVLRMRQSASKEIVTTSRGRLVYAASQSLALLVMFLAVANLGASEHMYKLTHTGSYYDYNYEEEYHTQKAMGATGATAHLVLFLLTILTIAVCIRTIRGGVPQPSSILLIVACLVIFVRHAYLTATSIVWTLIPLDGGRYIPYYDWVSILNAVFNHLTIPVSLGLLWQVQNRQHEASLASNQVFI